MSYLLTVYDRLRAAFPVNRVVALLAPILVGLAATAATWIADHLPLIADQLGPKQLEGVFIATAAAGVAAVYKWLDNWRHHEDSLRGLSGFPPTAEADSIPPKFDGQALVDTDTDDADEAV